MSNVTLDIAGRRYTVACATGEEAHIEELGRLIHGKIADLPNLGGQSDARTLLYAALLLADELHEGGARVAPAAEGPDIATPLESLADRLEALADEMEQS